MDQQNNQTQGEKYEQYQQQQQYGQQQYQQAPPYGQQYGQYQQPPHGQPYQQPYPYAKPKRPASGFAVASLVLGIIAMTLPVPVLDIIIGVLGLIFAIYAKKKGHGGGMSTAGLVLSILGTIWSIWFTISVFAGLMWMGSQGFNFHAFM